MGDAHLLFLRHSESPRSERVGRSREPFYDQLRIRAHNAPAVFAHKTIEAEEDSRVSARVDLYSLFEPEDGGMFASAEPTLLLNNTHCRCPPPCCLLSCSSHLTHYTHPSDGRGPTPGPTIAAGCPRYASPGLRFAARPDRRKS